MTLLDTDTAARDRQRLDWARAALGDGDVQLDRASMDAGFRSYWRTVDGAPTRIVMDSPPGLEDVRPWLKLHARLRDGGVRVPAILREDAANGFLLLEDLGRQTFLQVLDADNADALFDQAITQLLRIQSIAPDGLPEYDAALLGRELGLFDEWFLVRHLGLALDAAEKDLLDQAYRMLIDAALAQPRVFVHRDFMPRNLMPASDGPAVLDFQDAVAGPIAYDVISLFKDAFLSWPEARVQGWIGRYHARAAAIGLPVGRLEDFRRDADWIGMQRHLKVIGIFARLRHRDGKPKYLEDVTRFLDYLDAVLPRYEALAPLQAFIRDRVRPAMAQPPGAA